MDGGSVIIWVAFSLHRKRNIALLNERQNAESNFASLNQFLHPCMSVHLRNNEEVFSKKIIYRFLPQESRKTGLKLISFVFLTSLRVLSISIELKSYEVRQ